MKLSKIATGFLKYKNTLDSFIFTKDINISYYKLYWDCLWARIRYGCVLNHYTLGNFYKRKGWERKNIFTYRDWLKIIPTANDSNYIDLLENKSKFSKLFHNFLGRDILSSENMSFDEFCAFATKHRVAFIKPLCGWEGDGIHLLTLSPINQIELKNLFTDLKHQHVIIEERLTQHPEMVFGNNSINTIRAYTIYDSNSDRVFILKTVLRVGVGDSIVDNSHSGGCAYEVDKVNGYIISPYYRSDGSSEYIHPQTEICMLGKQIPQWDNVTSLICRAAKLIPQCRLIGWDVAITPHGPVLIEGNHNPDLDMIEFVGSYGYRDLIYHHLNLI